MLDVLMPWINVSIWIRHNIGKNNNSYKLKTGSYDHGDYGKG